MTKSPADPALLHQSFNIGAKALIIRKTHILLLRRRDHGRWEVPGGRINQGETTRQTLEREVKEELPGTTHVQIGDLLYADQTDFPLPNGNHLMLLLFRVSAKLSNPLTLSQEHTEACWVPLDKLTTFDLPQPVLAAAQKALQAK